MLVPMVKFRLTSVPAIGEVSAKFDSGCTALIAREPDAVLPLRIDGDRARALGLLSLLQRPRTPPAEPRTAMVEAPPARAAAG